MTGHRHLVPFESLNDRLSLSCPYFVDVVEPLPGQSSRNAMPWSRLFLVAADTAPGSAVTSLTARGAQRAVRLDAGTIAFMPPNLRLQFDFTPGLRMLAFHFRLDLAPGCDAFAGRRDLGARTGEGAVVADAYAAVRRLDADGGLEPVARLRGLLLTLASGFLGRDPVDLRRRLAAQGRFAAVLAHLDRACSAGLRVDACARLLGTSREHFAREFRRHLGLSPREHLQRLLVDRACGALLAGDKVVDAARALGFASEFAFSRFFKRRTGLSPTAFKAVAVGAPTPGRPAPAAR